MTWRVVNEEERGPLANFYPWAPAEGEDCPHADGLCCTRPAGHPGPHVAHGGGGRVIAIEDGPSELELIAIRNAAEERLNELCILLRMQFQIASLAGMERAEAPLGDQVRRVCLLARALETWPEGRL